MWRSRLICQFNLDAQAWLNWLMLPKVNWGISRGLLIVIPLSRLIIDPGCFGFGFGFGVLVLFGRLVLRDVDSGKLR